MIFPAAAKISIAAPVFPSPTDHPNLKRSPIHPCQLKYRYYEVQQYFRSAVQTIPEFFYHSDLVFLLSFHRLTHHPLQKAPSWYRFAQLQTQLLVEETP